MNIWLIITSSLALIGTVVAYLDKRKSNREKNTKSTYATVGLVIAILSIIFGFIVGVNSINEKKNAQQNALALDDSVQRLHKKNNELLLDQRDSTKKILRDIKRTLDSSMKIMALQHILANQITGGDSYPSVASVEVFRPPNNKTKVYINLRNEGDYFLDDIDVVVLSKNEPHRPSSIFMEAAVAGISLPNKRDYPPESTAGHIGKGRAYVSVIGRASISKFAPKGTYNIEVDKECFQYNIYISSRKQSWIIFLRVYTPEPNFNGDLYSHFIQKIQTANSQGVTETFVSPQPYLKEFELEYERGITW